MFLRSRRHSLGQIRMRTEQITYHKDERIFYAGTDEQSIADRYVM